MRTIIIGQAPGRTSDPARPLEGTAVARKLTGRINGLDAFDLMNLLGGFPGKAGKGDRFPAARARRAALAVEPLLRGRRVVVLGRAVARAFGLRADYLTWERHRGFTAAVVPHPSGVNRWWNDPALAGRARAFVRAEAKRSTKGADA